MSQLIIVFMENGKHEALKNSISIFRNDSCKLFYSTILFPYCLQNVPPKLPRRMLWPFLFLFSIDSGVSIQFEITEIDDIR